MNEVDYAVLIGALLAIVVYGMWKTRHRNDLKSYLRGRQQTPWFAIGLSVMATQASAITFLSTPGQGYLSGLSFVQIYFGVPLALLIIAHFFVPIYHRLNVYTAYEYLQRRFDSKTRVLGAALFLLQRGLGAGLTIYAPAIVLTTVFGWPLNATIIACGLLVMLYTISGGSDAVTVTQGCQIAVIFAGMATAAWLLISKLPPELRIDDAMVLAGSFHKLNAVSLSADPRERYTLFSGLIGGTFLMLSYFGSDQSQVQRYISGSSVRESRLGLLFNALLKIPMQFCILLLGVMLFLFYQFNSPPLFFDTGSSRFIETHKSDKRIEELSSRFDQAREKVTTQLERWLQARHAGFDQEASKALAAAATAQAESKGIQEAATRELTARNPHVKANEADYVFVTFILKELPHGAIGLLIAAFFAATLSSKAAELNALGASTTIDIYKHLLKPQASDGECLGMTRWFTFLWGLIAIIFALFARLAENLIQAVNILGSIFYGVMLALFIVGFFIRRVGGTAMFWAALAAQTLVVILYFSLPVSYLWFPFIGCGSCVLLSLVLQSTDRQGPAPIEEFQA